MNWKDDIWFNEHRDNIVKMLVRPGGIYGIIEGKVRLLNPKQLAYDISWAYNGNPNSIGCEFRNRIYWQQFQLLPAYCRLNCHKVVLSMTKVSDLMRCLTMQQQIYAVHGYSGKCGLDNRWYSPGLYKAFWYLSSLREGRECHEVVKETAESTLKHEHSVILKKGCTEMEHPHFGGRPSDQWGGPTIEDIQLENELEDVFGRSDVIDAQPPWLHNKIMWEWVKIANAVNDKSYTEFIEDITNYVPVTYHEQGGEEEQVFVLHKEAEEGAIPTVGGN